MHRFLPKTPQKGGRTENLEVSKDAMEVGDEPTKKSWVEIADEDLLSDELEKLLEKSESDGENDKVADEQLNGKRNRSAVSDGAIGDGAPAKKQRTYLERAKGAKILIITKSGDQHESLDDDEYKKIARTLDEAYYDIVVSNPDGPFPEIDWIGRMNQRTLVACADTAAVEFIKNKLKAISEDYGAWGPNEGPNAHHIKMTIPFPTGLREPRELMDMIKRVNKITGSYIIVKTDRKKDAGGRFLHVSVGQRFFDDLAERNFNIRVGLFKIHVSAKWDVEDVANQPTKQPVPPPPPSPSKKALPPPPPPPPALTSTPLERKNRKNPVNTPAGGCPNKVALHLLSTVVEQSEMSSIPLPPSPGGN